VQAGASSSNFAAARWMSCQAARAGSRQSAPFFPQSASERRLAMRLPISAAVSPTVLPARGAAIGLADRAVVERILRVRAGADAAEGLRVVGHGREVEGAIDAEGQGRAALCVEGADPDLLAPGEAIGLRGGDPRIEHVRVHRVGGVDVEVAPVDVALGIVVVAALAGGPGRRGERQRAQGGDEDEPGRCPSRRHERGPRPRCDGGDGHGGRRNERGESGRHVVDVIESRSRAQGTPNRSLLPGVEMGTAACPPSPVLRAKRSTRSSSPP
jgi:hypothetical protein